MKKYNVCHKYNSYTLFKTLETCTLCYDFMNTEQIEYYYNGQ